MFSSNTWASSVFNNHQIFSKLSICMLQKWAKSPVIFKKYCSYLGVQPQMQVYESVKLYQCISNNYCDPNFNRGHCPMPMHMWSIEPSGQIVDKLFIRNDHCNYCESDLWPSDPNFNRSLLLPKANVHVKYQAYWSIRWWVIDRKLF